MIRMKLLYTTLFAVGFAWSQMVSAITCGDPREATLDPASLCATGEGNTSTADILDYYGEGWTDLGESGGWLTIIFDTGDWNENMASGTWDIADAFWDEYDEAIISMHVGNGQPGDETRSPDHWAWLVSDTSSTWSYDGSASDGGGLSNYHLWGGGD